MTTFNIVCECGEGRVGEKGACGEGIDAARVRGGDGVLRRCEEWADDREGRGVGGGEHADVWPACWC